MSWTASPPTSHDAASRSGKIPIRPAAKDTLRTRRVRRNGDWELTTISRGNSTAPSAPGNYRYSTNNGSVIDTDTRRVVAVGRPVPGNRNDCTAQLSDAMAANGKTTAIADGGYRGPSLVIPHRREQVQTELPARQEEHHASHSKTRARIKHAFPRMKTVSTRTIPAGAGSTYGGAAGRRAGRRARRAGSCGGPPGRRRGRCQPRGTKARLPVFGSGAPRYC